MARTKIASLVLLLLFSSMSFGDISEYLQNISVTIKAGDSQGSGVLITRELKKTPESTDKVKVNFCWTAAHVVNGLRSTRNVVDSKTGQSKTVVEFGDPNIVKELIEDGRKVGQTEMTCRVIKYSDADAGEDLALLMVLKNNFVDVNTEFHLDEPKIIPVGTRVFHVGSLLGQLGANSLTSGIISQVGRIVNTDTTHTNYFDQTDSTSFPGSSGGGIFIAEDGVNKGKYLGMLVRGAGEGFGLMVPVRRMITWADSVNLRWAIDNLAEPPSLKELSVISVEDVGITFEYKEQTDYINKEYPFLIKIND